MTKAAVPGLPRTSHEDGSHEHGMQGKTAGLLPASHEWLGSSVRNES